MIDVYWFAWKRRVSFIGDLKKRKNLNKKKTVSFMMDQKKEKFLTKKKMS